MTLDGEPYKKDGAFWVNEKKPEYKISDGGMARMRANGRVKDVPTPDNPTDTSAGNWHYESRDFFKGGAKAKFAANVAAIKTLRAIQIEGRSTATREEQEILSKYIGWGQFPALFNYTEGWEKERETFKALVSDEEYRAARGSTLNAHYTHPDVVDAHWQIAQKLGYQGGRFLETSAGIGYYLGMMPKELAQKTKTSAVELDNLTGSMLSLLYPQANVKTQGFEEHQAPDGFYDLVASNVPFGAYKVHDPRYNKHNANIHDYFFLKSADLARPGGLVMHITSAGTLDKPDSKIREELAKTCDLVGAIRFPGGAHKENAGTEVVTDLLILRKRASGEQSVDINVTPDEAKPIGANFTGITTDAAGRLYHWKDGQRVPGPNWKDVTQVPDPAGGEPITVNKYFADNPDQILGTLDRTGTMYRGESVNVSVTDDFQDRLAKAIERLPQGIMKPAKASKEAFSPEKLPAPGDVKEGGFSIKDGKLYVRHGGALVEQQASAAQLARIEAHLNVRDAMRAVLNAQIQGQNADLARAGLNKEYDAFSAKYGPLNEKANKRAFAEDPDAPVLLAMEKWDSKAKTAAKADIFRKDTIRSVTPVTKANNAVEALGVSLHETGGVDVARMAKLVGKSEAEIAKELSDGGHAFQDPTEGWKPADQYLSGNVRRKLVLARVAAESDPIYRANVAALEKVQPEDIDHSEIEAKLGVPWVAPDDYAAFAGHLLGGQAGHFKINHIEGTGEWQANYTSQGESRVKYGRLARETWGTEDVPFMKLFQAALNNTQVTIQADKEADDAKAATNEAKKATDDANAKIQDMKDEFRKWLWDDDDRRERLHRNYNDNFNNIRPMKYDGSHLQFPGLSPDYHMRPHQNNFVWQVITTGSGLAAHEVGTGKTGVMIAAAMELRRLGLAKKPAIACLKANVEAITADAIKLYPGVKILSTADMLSKDKRRETISRMATGDYDMVIMSHDQLGMLQMKPETQAKFIREELDELRAAKDQMDEKKNPRAMKAMEKAQKNLEAKLEKVLAAGNKDNAIHFEETGIDHLFVDEAHLFKTLPVYTKQQRLKGIPTGRSQRATNMLMKTRWLQEQNNGRGVVFATGTPVSNTMAELYTMQRYLQPKELKERGISSFDDWARTFGDVQTKMELTVAGEYKPVSRFAKFVNLPELAQITGQTIDVQRADDQLNPDGTKVIVRPKRTDHVVIAPRNDAMTKLMADLQDRAKNLDPHDPAADNMLVICTDGRKGAMDMRLLDANAADDPENKTNLAIAKVLEIAKAKPGMAQVIFSDVGVHPSKYKEKPAADEDEIDPEAAADDAAKEDAMASKTGFHLYQHIIDKLVKGGIRRDQIADFSQLEGAEKEAASEGLRRGTVLVGIGSTAKLGTGVNVQDRLAALHHLDVPWVPAHIEQRDGRGWRQGNMNKDVDIYRYVSEGSLDQTFWQIVGNKAAFIRQVMDSNRGGKVARSVKDEDSEVLTPEQLSAAASGDPRFLEKVNVDEDVRILKDAEQRHARDQVKLKNTVKRSETDILDLKNEADKYRAIVKHLEPTKDADFAIDLNDPSAGDYAPEFKTYTDRKEAGEAYRALSDATNVPNYRHERIGTYRGMDILKSGGHIRVTTPEGDEVATGDSLGSIEAVLRGLPREAEKADAKAQKARQDIEKLQTKISVPFAKADELAAKLKRQQELETELKGEKEPKHEESRMEKAFKRERAEEEDGSEEGDAIFSPESTKEEGVYGIKGLPRAEIEHIVSLIKAGSKDRANEAFLKMARTNQLEGDNRKDVIAKLLAAGGEKGHYSRDYHAALADAADAVHPEPSDPQKDAGNYKKGHVYIHGLDVSIENPQGSIRTGKDKSGKEWSVTMTNHYGYLRRTEDRDGDNVDVFIGPHPASEIVFVVDQVDPATGKFDEHKCMIGFTSQREAKAAYLDNYQAGWKGFGSIRPLTMAAFKEWIKTSATRKPIEDQKLKMERRGEPLRYEAKRSPVGGVNIGGQFYPGGQWIPSEVVEGASEDEKKAIKGDTSTHHTYTNQAMGNLEGTSRTAKGVVDTTASKAKAQKMVEGLTPEKAKSQALGNFHQTIKALHEHRQATFTSPDTLMRFVDSVAASVNQGIVKPDALHRTDDSDKFPYTKAADLPLARKQFAKELFQRINDPKADPIETAGWIEWRANFTDHFWADGVGKTSKALGAWALMRGDLPLPKYRDNKELFENVASAKYDPKNGPDSYKDGAYDKWQKYYGSLFPATARQPVRETEKQYPPVNQHGKDTFERHGEDGKFSPQRQKLHDDVVAKVRSAVPAAEGEKTYTMMGGGPASGKSSILHAGMVTLPQHHVMIDSDAIKGHLPEYNPLVQHGDDRAANYVHEESSHLAKVIQQQSLAAGQHTVLDGTGDNSVDSVMKKIGQAKAAGYKVQGEYVTCSTQEAIRRNIERAKKTGRLPPEKMLRTVHRGVSEVLPELVKRGAFDNVRLWDSEHETDGKPTLVMSAQGANMTVHHPERWQAFLGKAKEEVEPIAGAAAYL